MRLFLSCVTLLLFGCNLTPVPKAVGRWHEQAGRTVPLLESTVRPGDIIFRLSNTQLAGGLVDFSETIAKSTESQLSHATLVYRTGPDGVVVADMTPTGIARRYLVDWYLDGTRNVVIRRLKPEYAELIPRVLAEMDKLIERDVLYDEKFSPDNDEFYCTEVVDHCFRAIGHPLAPLVRIKDFPKYDLILHFGCLIGGIDNRNLVAFAGNDSIGLFSSPMLETVLDLRGQDPPRFPLVPPTRQLVQRPPSYPGPQPVEPPAQSSQ